MHGLTRCLLARVKNIVATPGAAGQGWLEGLLVQLHRSAGQEEESGEIYIEVARGDKGRRSESQGELSVALLSH